MSFATATLQESGQAEDAFAASQSSLSSSLATEDLLDATDSQFSSWATMGCRADSATRVHQCMPCHLAASDKASNHSHSHSHSGGGGDGMHSSALHVDPLAHTPTALLAAARAAAKPCINVGDHVLWNTAVHAASAVENTTSIYVMTKVDSLTMIWIGMHVFESLCIVTEVVFKCHQKQYSHF